MRKLGKVPLLGFLRAFLIRMVSRIIRLVYDLILKTRGFSGWKIIRTTAQDSTVYRELHGKAEV